MRRLGGLYPIVLALGATILAPGLQAQDRREEPFEIEKCQTISQPGSYRLVENLTFSSPAGGTCLSITADNVTIDLAGFTISGPTTPSLAPPTVRATAIAAGDSTTGIAVRNGSISGFVAGVALNGGNSIVEGLRVSSCVETGIAATGIVRGNTVFLVAGGGPGIRSGIGISATGIITGNFVSIFGRIGIEAGPGSTVIGNTASFTTFAGASGLVVTCPSNVTNNTTVGNTGGNLVLDGNGCNNINNVAP